MARTARAAPAGRRLTVAGRTVPVVLPDPRDPRLRLSAVLLTVQVLGQTVLDFKLSVAQILVTIGVCALVETGVTLRREGFLALPASAMLTGNSVALLLRTTGTEHGDWWSLNGIEFFVAAGLLALGAKYLIRPGGRHVFNPSNVGLVWVLLVVGPTQVFPQYLWWGPWGVPVGVTVGVIAIGAVIILRRVGMVAMAAAFLATFAVLVGMFAAAGASFYAVWHEGPVTGVSYWVNIVASPEVLVFAFFMMSDPQTAPRTPVGRVVYGALTAVAAGGLLVIQPTEFGVKLAILSSLTVTCALAALIDAAVRRRRGERTLPVPPPSGRLVNRLRRAVRNPAIVAAVIVAVAAPVNTAALANDEGLVLIERGLSPVPDPQ